MDCCCIIVGICDDWNVMRIQIMWRSWVFNNNIMYSNNFTIHSALIVSCSSVMVVMVVMMGRRLPMMISRRCDVLTCCRSWSRWRRRCMWRSRLICSFISIPSWIISKTSHSGSLVLAKARTWAIINPEMHSWLFQDLGRETKIDESKKSIMHQRNRQTKIHISTHNGMNSRLGKYPIFLIKLQKYSILRNSSNKENSVENVENFFFFLTP